MMLITRASSTFINPIYFGFEEYLFAIFLNQVFEFRAISFGMVDDIVSISGMAIDDLKLF